MTPFNQSPSQCKLYKLCRSGINFYGDDGDDDDDVDMIDDGVDNNADDEDNDVDDNADNDDDCGGDDDDDDNNDDDNDGDAISLHKCISNLLANYVFKSLALGNVSGIIGE